ncbi:hypothetical protein [Flavobacterium beibuense]|uniref:Secreted protein n=1 Tax=Flavobacterium beibuense TaxID=657326 RepID=A0A444W9Z4_9FLAO|nr:hypothetical protein [Flavobacterium beibuense]RYJ42466.1 hypothetical protein NU09_2252 [Flavobacterium beibuense]
MKNTFRKTVLILAVCALTQFAHSQTTLTQKLENKEFSNLLGSIDSYTSYPVKLGSLSTIINYNESGSANMPETDEASQNLIITVCADGAPTDCNSFIFKDKYNLKVTRVTEDDKLYHVYVEYGPAKKRAKEELLIAKP